MSNMRVETRKLGLAAFIKMNGGQLVKYESGRFHLDADKTEQQWEVAYMNSCCHRHDTELVNLRKLMK